MSDCSPLRLADNGQSSPSQSLTSQNSQTLENRGQRLSDGAANRNQNRDHHVRLRTQSASSSKSGQLKYGAKNVIELFVPVSLCMLIVVGTLKATDSYRYSSQSIIWYAQMMFTDQTVDTGTRVWQSFANAFILLIFIVVMTTVLALLFKFRCYKTIHGWIILSSLVMLFMFTIMYIAQFLKVYNIPIDIYTLSIVIWNFGVVGMICVHWKGPLLLQQGYLITISALLALAFIRCLPDWTVWTVLAIVSVWDLVAVLCPNGPLRILVETAQERNEPIFPALIYSSAMVWEVLITMADKNQPNSTPKRSGRRNKNPASQRRPQREHPVEIHYEDEAQPPEVAFIQPSVSSTEIADSWQRPVVQAVQVRTSTTSESAINFQHQDPRLEIQVEEERGVKLGLGDFIFYSVLIGKASSYGDWTITVSCYVAILVGLSLTLSLLAVFRKALPALPISIAFGLSSFFLSYVFVVPFAGTLSINQVFI